MITIKQKTIMFGLSGLLPVILAGCATPETVKPTVRTAVAKPGNTYIVKQAAIHTPATDRLWQQRKANRAQQLAAKRQYLLSKQRAQVAPVKANSRPAPRNVNQNTNAAKVLQQQAKSRAEYHARYKAKQQALAKRKVAQAPRAKYKPRRTQAIKNKAPATQIARRQPAKNNARPAQVKASQARRAPQKNTEKSMRQHYVKRWEEQQALKRLESKKADARVERVIHNAKKQIGTKYVWGGASPKTGFDCSGLVQHSMKKGAGVKVPRTAAEQYKVAVKIPTQKASRGDLVFFKTRGNSVSHVGIFLGDNKFVHAPRTGRRITTSKLSGYWKQRFVGFGRIPGACKVPV